MRKSESKKTKVDSPGDVRMGGVDELKTEEYNDWDWPQDDYIGGTEAFGKRKGKSKGKGKFGPGWKVRKGEYGRKEK